MTRLEPRVLAALVDALGGAKKALAIADVDEGSEVSADLSELARAAREVKMTTGADELAIGFPWLEGRAPDGTWIRAPLFLYAASLGFTKTGKRRWALTLDGGAYLNDALCEVLSRLAGIRLSTNDFLANDDDQVFKADNATWQGMLETLQRAGLALFDQAHTLPDRPEALAARSAEERQAAPSGQWRLNYHLILGRFPLAATTLVNDYDVLIERPDDADLGVAESLLSIDDGERAVAPPMPTDHAASNGAIPSPLAGRLRWQVVPSDRSQDAIFEHLERTRAIAGGPPTGLVVQGPPGTGKSQLITNLLAAAIAKGERVLLVCQKRAALDVVAERLERLGLREPIALVHDVQRDRGEVCAAIAATLDEGADAAADPARTLRAAEATAERVERQLRDRLAVTQAAWTALACEEGGQPSLAALDEEAVAAREPPNAAVLAALVDPALAVTALTDEALVAAAHQLDPWAPQAARFAAPHPFAERSDWGALGHADLAALAQRVHLAQDAVAAFGAAGRDGIAAERLRANASVWTHARGMVTLASGYAAAWEEHATFRSWLARESAGRGQTLLAHLRTERASLADVPDALVGTPTQELAARATKLERLSALERHWWRIFLPTFWALRGLRRRLAGGLAAGTPASAASGTDAVLALHREGLRWHALLAHLPEHPVFHLPRAGEPAALDPAIGRLESGLAVHEAERALRSAFGEDAFWPPDPAWRSSDEDAAYLAATRREHDRHTRLVAAQHALAALAPAFRASFVATLQAALVSDPGQVGATLGAIAVALPDVPEVVRLDQSLAPLEPFARAFLRAYGGPVDDAAAAIQAAVHALWRDARKGGKSAVELDQHVVDPRLPQALEKLRAEARAAAPGGVLAAYRDRLQGARAGRPRAGQAPLANDLPLLAAECRKRKNRASLRQLCDRFWLRGLALVRPVWFCSPESVAALFSLDADVFDLVIFDEASQCPVESAIPALCRSRLAVIAGDEQQMPPSHFFQAALGDEPPDDDALPEALLASQSILGLARIAFPSTTLSWHYRSRHESLIAFSNAAFYGKTLATAPNAEERARRPYEGLHWRHVDGRWKDQTNPVEAEAVVDLVAEVLGSAIQDAAVSTPTPLPTLGIVALNRPQADLIARRIEAREARDETFRALIQRDGERPIVDQIFVRNLENVQGDERDVMILSVAYAASEASARVAARFGPLGLDGGEKRLNVAVTRAKLGLFVVASITPEQLQVERTANPGPKLLRAFLAFVARMAAGDETGARQLLADAQALSGQPSDVRAERGEHRVGTRVAAEIAAALEARGQRVQRHVGLGRVSLDLAVATSPDAPFSIGVDTSGFLARPDAWYRDHDLPIFWQRVGWRIVRVTPGRWRADPEGVLASLQSTPCQAK